MAAAVLTGDIVRSSDLSPERRKELQETLENAFQTVSDLLPGFRAEQYRGDSFQALLETRPQESLRSLLLIQARLRIREFGVRIALGLGDVSYESGSIPTSDGSAFQLSGPALDELKRKNQLVTVVGSSESFNGEWKVHSLALSYLLQRWTASQAEAVYWQLQGLTQEETAKRLDVRQPTVNQSLQSVGWPLMDAILERFVSSLHVALL
jgi:hypothetical protein